MEVAAKNRRLRDGRLFQRRASQCGYHGRAQEGTVLLIAESVSLAESLIAESLSLSLSLSLNR